MGKYLWLAVEIDEYELPLYVADSARELAEKFGTTKHNVECNVLRGDNGRISGRRFIRVLNDGQETQRRVAEAVALSALQEVR